MTSRRGRQPILVIYLAIGMGLTATALRGSSNVPWDVADSIFIAALLADLALLLERTQPVSSAA